MYINGNIVKVNQTEQNKDKIKSLSLPSRTSEKNIYTSDKTNLTQLRKDEKIPEQVLIYEKVSHKEESINSREERKQNADNLKKHIDIPDAETLSLTGSLLTLVPGAEVAKLSVNVMSTDKRIDKLKTSIKEKNVYDITKNSVYIVKNGWGSVYSTTKLANLTATVAHELNYISKGTLSTVGKATSTTSRVAGAINLPFALLGTGIYGLGVVDKQKELNAKKNELENLDRTIVDNMDSKIIKKVNVQENIDKINEEVKEMKLSRNLKGVAFGISTVASTALMLSVTAPQTAPITAPIALFGSVTASIVSNLSYEEQRESLKEGLFKNKKLFIPFSALAS